MKLRKPAMVIFITAIGIMLLTWGCTSVSRNWHMTGEVLHEGIYNLAGRVVDMRGKPVDGAMVYLLRAYYRNPDPEYHDRTTEEFKDSAKLVATTGTSGEFLVTFELFQADSVWILMDAPEHGYETRLVNLNRRMGNSWFHQPGNKTLSVHVIMEKS